MCKVHTPVINMITCSIYIYMLKCVKSVLMHTRIIIKITCSLSLYIYILNFVCVHVHK